MADLAHEIINKFEKIASKRSTFENVWNDISAYFLPNRGMVTTALADGTMVDPRISTGEGQQLVEKLAATIISGAINTKTKWIKLTSNTPKLNNDHAFLEWADEAADVLMATFLNQSGNFENQNYQFILDLIAYGTAGMCVTKGTKETPVLFRTRHISQLYLDEDYTGKVDSVYSRLEMTPRQLVQQFGIDNVSNDVQKEFEEGSDQRQVVIHAVLPTIEVKNIGDVQIDKKFTSIYIEKESGHILLIEGFNQNPYIASRWVQYTGEVYGRSPAWIGLPILRQLNFLNVMKSKGLTLAITPPIMMSDDAVIPQVRIEPFGLIPGALNEAGQAQMQFLTPPSQLDKAFFEEDKLKQTLEGIFYIGSLPDQNKVAMTAYEVQQRTLKELKAMGPQITKLISEYLDPLIKRVFSILLEGKYITPLPKDFGNVNIDINYTGYLANIQKLADVEALNTLMNTMVPVANIDPTVLEIFDFESIMRHTSSITGLPPRMIRSPEEIAQIQQQKQDAQQQQMQLQQAQQLQGTASAISQLRGS